MALTPALGAAEGPLDGRRKIGMMLGEPDRVLHLVGAQEKRADSRGGDGHAEALPRFDPPPSATGQHPLRQVPRPAPPGDALDTVGKSEYARLSGKDCRFIKGQKYTL